MQDHVLAPVGLGCGRAVSPDGKGRLIGAHGHSMPARAMTAKEISHGLTPGAMALVSANLPNAPRARRPPEAQPCLQEPACIAGMADNPVRRCDGVGTGSVVNQSASLGVLPASRPRGVHGPSTGRSA